MCLLVVGSVVLQPLVSCVPTLSEKAVPCEVRHIFFHKESQRYLWPSRHNLEDYSLFSGGLLCPHASCRLVPAGALANWEVTQQDWDLWSVINIQESWCIQSCHVKNTEISADLSSLFDICQGFLIKSIFLKLSVIGRKLFFQQLYNILIIKFKLF